MKAKIWVARVKKYANTRPAEGVLCHMLCHCKKRQGKLPARSDLTTGHVHIKVESCQPVLSSLLT
jgi:hypothetical protein